jgi:protoporphyrin/coproporphyrin ferrochelatase
MSERLAVVLFNLGGPDSLEAVQPFLFNLFNDEAIIGAPRLVRRLLATLLSRRRAPVAREIYRQLGGASPLLTLTREQAQALERTLRERGHDDARVFVCMRYWHPMSDAVAAEVQSFAPDRIVLLPLYPQFSTTTTASSLADWRRAARAVGLTVPEAAVCCYPTDPGLVAAVVRRIRTELERTGLEHGFRILFSAHGLPEKVIARGDPYQWQVERTSGAVVEAMSGETLDHVVCYQSRVGPLKWIGPSTEEALEEAAADGVAAVVVPIAFVSEHSETLVELDIEYRNRARELGVPQYVRVPAVGTADEFVSGLADLVERSRREIGIICPDEVQRCSVGFRGCPCVAGGRSAPG